MSAVMTKAEASGRKVDSHADRPTPRNGVPFTAERAFNGTVLLTYHDHNGLPYQISCGHDGQISYTVSETMGRKVLALLNMYREIEQARDLWLAERDSLLERTITAEGVAEQYRGSASQKARADVKRRTEG